MNAAQAENLRALIRHMETNCARTLNMNRVLNECGTPACAWGEATIVLGVKHEGSYVEETQQAFGLDGLADVDRLFSNGVWNAWRRSDVTPLEWAAEARKVLAEHGYSLDDGFAVFRAKLLEPVAVTA